MVLECQLGIHPLELSMLSLERLQSAQLRDIHAGVFGLPVESSCVGNAVLAADFCHFRTGIDFFQDPDNLFF